MVSDTQQTVRRVNYILLMFCMMLSIAGLSFTIFSIARSIESANEQMRPSMVRLAWVAVVCLGGNVLVLLWIFIRWMRLRLTPPAPLPDTPYKDAWNEAGKRIQVDENDDVLGDEPPDLWRE